MQQEVERQTCPARRIGLRQAQGAVLDGQIGARRDDVEVFRQDGHAVLGLQHRQGRMLGQQFHEHAGVSGIEVLDQHEGHCCRRGQGIEQLRARLKAAGRRADRDDPHFGTGNGWCARHHRPRNAAPAEGFNIKCGLEWDLLRHVGNCSGPRPSWPRAP